MTLFCSDIDGTLLNPERTLSPRTIAALTRLREAGQTFVLCSSRPPASMRILEGLYGGGGVPMIAYNGGLVLRADGSISLDIPIPAVHAREIYEHCLELGLHGSFYSGENWYVWAEDHWSGREINNTGISPRDEFAKVYYESGEIDTAPPHKIMAMGDAELIDEIERRLAEVPGLVTYRSKDTYLEIANSECSKGSGLRAVAESLGEDLKDTIFFGDNFNDLPAFAVVGTSVAVANAKDDVLAAATDHTERHHDDGVAIWIENWLDAHA